MVSISSVIKSTCKIISNEYSSRNQTGGDFSFGVDGRVITTEDKKNKFKSFVLSQNDHHNIKIFEEHIMPYVKFDGTVCGTNLKTEAKEISMGGFGILFKFNCTANNKKFSMKISVPSKLQNDNDWNTYYNENKILDVFGGINSPTASLLLPKYYGYIDLTGRDPNNKGKLVLTSNLISIDQNRLDEVEKMLIFPSSIMIFFQEWLDGDLNQKLTFQTPLEIFHMIVCFYFSLSTLQKGYNGKPLVHCDIKGGNLMVKKLNSKHIQFNNDAHFVAFNDDDRRVYKVIDLGGVQEEGAPIDSYTPEYLSPELLEMIDNKGKIIEEYETLKKSGASAEIINETVEKFRNAPTATAQRPQDIYALGLGLIETLGASPNGLNMRGSWLASKNINKLDQNTASLEFAKYINQVMESLNYTRAEDISYLNKKYVNEYNQLSNLLINEIKYILNAMVAPVNMRINNDAIGVRIAKILNSNKLLRTIYKHIYIDRFSEL
jgi:serine/threonine protein kinase